MPTFYQNIIDYPLLSGKVKEKNQRYFSFTERHLQIVWFEQKILKNLVTSQGETIEVVSPGIWNLEAGPDFLNAYLRIGQQDYRGDVEIHVHPSGWYAHGHHCDPRYNRVILHVSYECLSKSLPISKENGQQVHSCYLNNSLNMPIEQLMASIDLDFYPSKIFPNRGRCAEHLFQVLSEEKIKNFFQSAAYWRLEKKLNSLQVISSERALQFACGIAMAMGYKHNAKAFLDLFLYLMDYRDLPYQELLAIALGCCGFLEEKRKDSWESSAYYQHLRSLWGGRKNEIMHQACLKLDHIRPFHHPIRRLAYLTHFLQDAHLENLWSRTFHVWETAMAMAKLPLRQLREDLLDIFPIYSDDYWDCHYTFEHPSNKKSLPCLGRDLKMHILLNTTLPLLYATVKEMGNLTSVRF